MPPSEALPPPLTFYAAYCFSASPTWFVWVKVTAHSIHHVLRSRAGFTAATTNPKAELLFYLNHPIQYVQVIGVIVAFDEYFDKFWSITVDDGSGEVVDCVCWKPDREQVKHTNRQEGDTKPEKIDVEQQRRDEVIRKIDIGTVVQVKGTITSFRDVRQIQIERLAVIPATNQEVMLIAARTKFLEDVLMRPWVVSANRQKRLYKDSQGEVRKKSESAILLRQRQRKLEEREVRHAERIAKEYARDEEQRKTDAETARQAGRELQQQRLQDVVSDDDFADLTY
jgi:hypothetical protein